MCPMQNRFYQHVFQCERTCARWKVQSVDLKERTVTFKKMAKEGMAQMARGKRGKRKQQRNLSHLFLLDLGEFEGPRRRESRRSWQELKTWSEEKWYHNTELSSSQNPLMKRDYTSKKPNQLLTTELSKTTTLLNKEKQKLKS